MIKEYNLVAYIGKSFSVGLVKADKMLPVFAVEGEKMEDAGFKRIGTARVSVELDEIPESEDQSARAAYVRSVA